MWRCNLYFKIHIKFHSSPQSYVPSFSHSATYRSSLLEANLMCGNQNSLKRHGDSFLYKSVHQNVPKK
jgi:hypothetical protein